VARNQFVNSLSVRCCVRSQMQSHMTGPGRVPSQPPHTHHTIVTTGLPGQAGRAQRDAGGADEERCDGGAVLPTGPRLCARCLSFLQRGAIRLMYLAPCACPNRGE
jgi:hypothetical protein